MVIPAEVIPPIADDVILFGLTGSQAYGLDTPESDYDWKGIFQVPTRQVLGLYPGTDKTRETSAPRPDTQVHELEKYLRLAVKCNPTLLEMMWLDDYAKITEAGQLLIDNRELFLWSKPLQGSVFGQCQQKLKEILKLDQEAANTPREGVMSAYVSYAKDQFRRVVDRDGTYKSKLQHRTAKHTRHMFRLLDQGRQLLTTGELTVRVSPEQRERLFMLGDLPIADMVPIAERELAEFRKLKTVLPTKPRTDEVSELLIQLRLAAFERESA